MSRLRCSCFNCRSPQKCGEEGDQETLIPVIEAFVRTVDFMDRLRQEGHIRDYALIGGLALSAWPNPGTRGTSILCFCGRGHTWPGIAALVESGFRKKTVVKKDTSRTTIQDKLSFVTGQIEVDLIGRGDLPWPKRQWRTHLSSVFRKAVKIATPEYLILLKLIPLGAQDKIDIGALLGERTAGSCGSWRESTSCSQGLSLSSGRQRHTFEIRDLECYFREHRPSRRCGTPACRCHMRQVASLLRAPRCPQPPRFLSLGQR